eukprot:m.29198 g.29198  ORF g.29198 m.29198 type:complete len:73 (+) comp31148_c0_seq3:1430-1648(+)
MTQSDNLKSIFLFFYNTSSYLPRVWEEGKMIILDDSFEHEVWHNGSSFRLIFIIDVWHPDITEHEKQTLPPI